MATGKTSLLPLITKTRCYNTCEDNKVPSTEKFSYAQHLICLDRNDQDGTPPSPSKINQKLITQLEHQSNLFSFLLFTTSNVIYIFMQAQRTDLHELFIYSRQKRLTKLVRICQPVFKIKLCKHVSGIFSLIQFRKKIYTYLMTAEP